MKRRIKRLISLPLLLMALIMAIVPVVSAAAAPPEYIITTINVPTGAPNGLYGINPSGDVVGVLLPAGPGFTLINSKYETYTYPGAWGTSLIGIGPSGEIVGDYAGPGYSTTYYHWHGFMVTKEGETIDIDDGIHDTLVPFRVLPDGTIIGHVQLDPAINSTRHGFVMHPDGSFEYNETMPLSQHNSATPDGRIIVGSYLNGSKFCGYVLENGNLTTTFDIPGSSMTLAWDVNPAGNVVVGYYTIGSYPWPAVHGYIAEKRGNGSWNITDFDVPEATWTFIQGISPGGELAGRYKDKSGVVHGFIASPNNRK